MTVDLSRRAVLRLAAAAALVAPLAACGKRGALERPPTEAEVAAEQQARAEGKQPPKRKRDTKITPPRKETPFDVLL